MTLCAGCGINDLTFHCGSPNWFLRQITTLIPSPQPFREASPKDDRLKFDFSTFCPHMFNTFESKNVGGGLDGGSLKQLKIVQ